MRVLWKKFQNEFFSVLSKTNKKFFNSSRTNLCLELKLKLCNFSEQRKHFLSLHFSVLATARSCQWVNENKRQLGTFVTRNQNLFWCNSGFKKCHDWGRSSGSVDIGGSPLLRNCQFESWSHCHTQISV